MSQLSVSFVVFCTTTKSQITFNEHIPFLFAVCASNNDGVQAVCRLCAGCVQAVCRLCAGGVQALLNPELKHIE